MMSCWLYVPTSSLGSCSKIRNIKLLPVDAPLTRLDPCQVSLDGRAQVAVGGQHAVLVTRNGKLYEWGAGVGGRLLAGAEATSPERVPTLWSRRCVFDGFCRAKPIASHEAGRSSP